MKNSSDPIKNRTHNLPACSTVPQPTALPHSPPQQVNANIKVGVQIHIVFATVNIAVYNSLSHVHYKCMLFKIIFSTILITQQNSLQYNYKIQKCIFSPVKIIKKLAPDRTS
jgi:hypothetical protein